VALEHWKKKSGDISVALLDMQGDEKVKVSREKVFFSEN